MSALILQAPLAGLGAHVDYKLEAVPNGAGLYSLTAAGDPRIKIFALDAAMHLPSYSPDIPPSKGQKVLVLVNAKDKGVSVNLLAPLVLAGDTGRQMILDGPYSVAEPLKR